MLMLHVFVAKPNHAPSQFQKFKGMITMGHACNNHIYKTRDLVLVVARLQAISFFYLQVPTLFDFAHL